MRGMVFAAGYGTRLRPLTDTMPKALVEVGGVSMLEKVLLRLKAVGLDRVVVNTHHFAPMIEDFLGQNGDFGMEIALSHEADGPFDTGGAIKFARPMLEGERFLVHNVDILSNLDLRRFMGCDEPGSLATLLVQDVEAERKLLFDSEMRLVGWRNCRTGELKTPFAEPDIASCRQLSFCGIHILSDEVFGLMEEWPRTFSIIDFYLRNAVGGRIRGVMAPEGFRMIDIGTPEKLAEAQRSGL